MFLNNLDEEALRGMFTQDDRLVDYLNKCMESVDEKNMPWLSTIDSKTDKVDLIKETDKRVSAESSNDEDEDVNRVISFLQKMYLVMADIQGFHQQKAKVGATHAFSLLVVDRC